MMKIRTMVMAVAATVLTLAAVSCGKNNKEKEEEATIDGCWELYT